MRERRGGSVLNWGTGEVFLGISVTPSLGAGHWLFPGLWLLTGGGPVDNLYYGSGSQAQSTDLLVTWLYRLTTDQNPKYNIASVIGIVIFIISAALSLITYNRTAAAKSEEAFQ